MSDAWTPSGAMLAGYIDLMLDHEQESIEVDLKKTNPFTTVFQSVISIAWLRSFRTRTLSMDADLLLWFMSHTNRYRK